MEKKSRKIRLWLILAIFPAIVLLLLATSPYGTKPGFDQKRIETEITIAAPPMAVFDYLGNSANASDWSTFVDHILPTNADQVQDGLPGSIRRCFCRPDRTGMQWDELVTEVVPGEKRQLTIYNLRNFPMTAEGLATEQLYKPLGKEQTRLTFTLFFKDHTPSPFETVKMYIAAYRVEAIFKANLANIKRLVEARHRPD